MGRAPTEVTLRTEGELSVRVLWMWMDGRTSWTIELGEGR